MKTVPKLALLGSLYLAQGLPFGFFTIALPTLMRKQGHELSQIGLTSLLALPWALKFLWAPYVDRHGSDRIGRRKSWILPLQVLSAALAAALAFVDPARGLPPLMIGLFFSNLTAATQDIATDGLAVDILSPEERGHGNGIQVAAYRVGMILGGGALLWLFDARGWFVTFAAMSFLLLLSTAPVLFYRERPTKSHTAPTERENHAGPSGSKGPLGRGERESSDRNGDVGVVGEDPHIPPTMSPDVAARGALSGKERSSDDSAERGALSGAVRESSPNDSARREALSGEVGGDPHYTPPKHPVSPPAGPSWIEVIRRPKMLAWLLVLFLYKSGEALSYGMVKPMLVDRGLSLADIGFIIGTVGFVAGLAGAMLGGALVSRAGRGRALGIAGVLQIVGILSCLVPALGVTGGAVIAVVSAAEHLTSGVATVTLFTVMMDVCGEEAAATEYTVQASAVVIATGVASTLSGFVAKAIGYPAHFVVSAILSAVGLLYTMWAWKAGRIPPARSEEQHVG